MTSLAEETGPRKAESLFHTLAGKKLGKLMCRQVMGNLERPLRRIDSIQQFSSHVLRLLFWAFLALTIPSKRKPGDACLFTLRTNLCTGGPPLALCCLPLVRHLCGERVVWLGVLVRPPSLVTTF